jgi:hypothetical protein
VKPCTEVAHRTVEDADLPKPFEPRPLIRTLELREIGMRATINGLALGNLPGLEMRSGERVRWYLGSLGEENGEF